MHRDVRRSLKLYASILIVLLLTSTRPAGQAPARAVTPANPTILVGQTQQFTATGMSAPAAIDGGGNHTCLLMSDRSVRCFGQNNWGQLGDGRIGTDASTPVVVSGMNTAVDVGAGMEHTCSVLTDGTMRCWGTSYVGQLGDGTFNGWSDVPKPVLNLSGAIAGVVGGFHTCAILSDRSMRCWGRNQDGQVGNGDNTTDVSVPHAVIGLGGPVSTATAGGYHTCALMPNATVRCWGRNTRGQLGDGTENFFSSTPVPVSGMTNAAAVAGGGWHTCALLQNGTVQCWGENDNGQLGNTLSHSTVPVTVAGISNAVAISAGVNHSCAVLADGTTRCWGRNDSGQLGNGTTVNSSSPVQVSALSGPMQIALGSFHSCVLMPNRSGRCWGWNANGQLGNGTITNASTPVNVSGTGGLTWTSSNPSVATINAAGLATGVASGTTTITASDGSGSASTTLTVTQSTQRVTLSTILQGNGAGSISSSPAGIACGTDCTEDYDNGTTVTLTATAGSGSAFAGWTGCDSMSGMTCTVMMSAAKTVTATFNLQTQTFPLTVGKAGAGGGTVTSSPAGINCGADCSESYNSGTTVTLTAAAATGSAYGSWNGCNSVAGAICTVSMTAAKTVTVTFNLQPQTFALTVGKAGAGGGTVTSSPAGITCGADCSESYNSGTTVTLTPAAATGSVFGSWSGCNSVSGEISVSMSTARTVTATFNLAPPQTFTLTVGKAGAGSGTVASNPVGISCGADCSESYTSGTMVTLTPTAATGSVFGSWSGCTSVSGTTCTVSMNAAKSVTASFNLQTFTLTVGKAGAGSGTVASNPVGISCGADCSESYTSGTMVTLTPTAATGSVFGNWSGCTSVSGTTCTVSMNAAKSVTATFNLQFFPLTVVKTGAITGTVSSSPAGINCGSTCTASFASNAVVTLTASPTLPVSTVTWTGCDSSSGRTCTVATSRARSVTAAFKLLGVL